MGSFEKLVVATVFFLSAIVLAVSLSSRDGEDETGSPLAGGQAVLPAPERLAEAPSAVEPTEDHRPAAAAPDRSNLLASSGEPAERAAPPAPLLSTSIDPARGATAPEVVVPAPERAATSAPTSDGTLRARDGLERSPLEGRLLYTWRAGDTWTAVAERLYGSGSWADALRVVNDDARPAAGERVFVLERLGAAARETAADPRAPRPAPAARTPEPTDAPVTVTDDGAFVEHVVQTGDTLSSIAERYYGTAARWQRIHDANRDALRDPNTLVVGTRLKIP